MSGLAKDMMKLAIMAKLQAQAAAAGQTDVTYYFINGPSQAGVGEIHQISYTASFDGDTGEETSSTQDMDITTAAQQMMSAVDAVTTYGQIMGTGIGGAIPGQVLVPPGGITMAG